MSYSVGNVVDLCRQRHESQVVWQSIRQDITKLEDF